MHYRGNLQLLSVFIIPETIGNTPKHISTFISYLDSNSSRYNYALSIVLTASNHKDDSPLSNYVYRKTIFAFYICNVNLLRHK